MAMSDAWSRNGVLVTALPGSPTPAAETLTTRITAVAAEVCDRIAEDRRRDPKAVAALLRRYVSGEITWPGQPVRNALCAVLGVVDPAQLGFVDRSASTRAAIPPPRLCARCEAPVPNSGALACRECRTTPEILRYLLPPGFYDRADISEALRKHQFTFVLRQIRKVTLLGQEHIAAIMSISQSRVSELEGGRSAWSGRLVVQAANRLGIGAWRLGFDDRYAPARPPPPRKNPPSPPLPVHVARG